MENRKSIVIVLSICSLLILSTLLVLYYLDSTKQGYIYVEGENPAYDNGKSSPASWIENGTEVYYDDSRVYISSTAVSNEPVIRLMSKIYTGDINFALGFNTENVRPTWAGYLYYGA